MIERDTFLATVRESLERGTRPGDQRPEAPAPYRPPAAPAAEERIRSLIHELEAVGGIVHHAASSSEARTRVVEILRERDVRSIVRGNTSRMKELDLDPVLQAAGIEVTVCDGRRGTPREELRQAALAADAGVCSADFGVAETGTLALLARPGQGRSISLLPPLHVAVLDAGDVVQELAELFEKTTERGIPSALTLITGPSRTGDIELVLTIGVHGPGELHLVLMT
ncbi:MAG: lactate utilization protein [Thermoanaerobaculia bacterium]